MQDNDERLRQAIRVGNIGIFEHDHETDVIYWSPALRDTYGWDPEEPATLPKIISHVHPDDIDRVIASVRAAHDPTGDGTFDIEHRIVDRSGRLHWVLTRSQTHFHSVSGEQRPARTIGAVQDVTERRLANERLWVLDTVLRSSAQAIAIADSEGRLTFANAALQRLWGYPDGEDLLGRSLFEFWKIPEDAFSELIRSAESRILNVEIPANRYDGSPFYLGITAEAVRDAKGSLQRILVTFSDITENKRVADALRLKDQAIASFLIGIAMSDASGKIIYANREFLRLWGWSHEEDVLGRSLWDFSSPEGSRMVAERVMGLGSFQGEIIARRVNGTTLDLNVSAHALRGPDDELMNVVASFADVTDRKRLEGQLAHGRKMESLGRLAGGVAHDFNNLLTVICGGLELGMVQLQPQHPGRAHLSDAADAARSAATLTRQLLAFSRKDVIAPKVLDLNDVLERVRKMITRLIGSDIELEIIYQKGVLPISFDPGQVEQIILNLAVNARDAMTSGGRLTIETANVTLDEEEAGRRVGGRAGAYVLLRVSDNGIGMTDEVRAHLFEPFFTTKETGKGTGLGLAMVYGAVQQNGASIEVHSRPNQGTTFDIYLPAAPGDVPTLGARTQRAAEMGNASILLVEDDRRVRAFAEAALVRLGYTVHSFPSGNAALDAIRTLSPPPEIMITDVLMPGIDGRLLAERVATIFPGIVVLFVSGHTDVVVDYGTSNERGEVLAKPYSVEQLAQRVADALRDGARR